MKKLFFLICVFCFHSTLCFAETCTAMPTCEQLGYYMGTNIACGDDDWRYIHCPFDKEYRKCINYDCEKMGFKKYALEELRQWCEEDKIIRCPFDDSYVLCKDIVICEEPVLRSDAGCITAVDHLTNCGKESYKYACNEQEEEICYKKQCVKCTEPTEYKKKDCITRLVGQTNCGKNTYEYACTAGETCYKGECLVCETPLSSPDESRCLTQSATTNCGENTYIWACEESQVCGGVGRGCEDCEDATPYNQSQCITVEDGVTNCGVKKYKSSRTPEKPDCFNGEATKCEKPVEADTINCVTKPRPADPVKGTAEGKTNCDQNTYVFACEEGVTICKIGQGCVPCETPKPYVEEQCVTKPRPADAVNGTAEGKTNCGQNTYVTRCDASAGEMCLPDGNGGYACLTCEVATGRNDAECVTKEQSINVGRSSCQEKTTFVNRCAGTDKPDCDHKGNCVVCETPLTSPDASRCLTKQGETNCGEPTYVSKCLSSQTCTETSAGKYECVGCEESVAFQEGKCMRKRPATDYAEEGKTNCGDPMYEAYCPDGQKCLSGTCTPCSKAQPEDPDNCLTKKSSTQTNCGEDTYVSACVGEQECRLNHLTQKKECLVCDVVPTNQQYDESKCRTEVIEGSMTNCGEYRYKVRCTTGQTCALNKKKNEYECMVCETSVPNPTGDLCLVKRPATADAVEGETNCGAPMYEPKSCTNLEMPDCYQGNCTKCDSYHDIDATSCYTTPGELTNCGKRNYVYDCNRDTQICTVVRGYGSNKLYGCVTCETPLSSPDESKCYTQTGQTNCGATTYVSACTTGQKCCGSQGCKSTTGPASTKPARENVWTETTNLSDTSTDSDCTASTVNCTVDCTVTQDCGCGGTQTAPGKLSGTQQKTGKQTKVCTNRKKKITYKQTRDVNWDACNEKWITGDWSTAVKTGEWVEEDCSTGDCQWTYSTCNTSGGCVATTPTTWSTCTKSDCASGSECRNKTCVACTDLYKQSDGWYKNSTPSGCYKLESSATCAGDTYRKYSLFSGSCVSSMKDCYYYTNKVTGADTVTYYYGETKMNTQSDLTSTKPSVTTSSCHKFSSGLPTTNTSYYHNGKTCYYGISDVTSSKPETTQTLKNDDSATCSETCTSTTDYVACGCGGKAYQIGTHTGKKYRDAIQTRSVTCTDGNGWSTGSWSTTGYGSTWTACGEFGTCGNYTTLTDCIGSKICTSNQKCMNGSCVNCDTCHAASEFTCPVEADVTNCGCQSYRQKTCSGGKILNENCECVDPCPSGTYETSQECNDNCSAKCLIKRSCTSCCYTCGSGGEVTPTCSGSYPYSDLATCEQNVKSGETCMKSGNCYKAYCTNALYNSLVDKAKLLGNSIQGCTSGGNYTCRYNCTEMTRPGAYNDACLTQSPNDDCETTLYNNLAKIVEWNNNCNTDITVTWITGGNSMATQNNPDIHDNCITCNGNVAGFTTCISLD